MRLRLGRPDLAAHAARFDVPAADGGPGVTFAGVCTLLFDDGQSAVLTDGFFSRPSLARVGLRRIALDHARIGAALDRLGGSPVSLVVPVHTPFDHALDSAEVARRTGALLLCG